MTRILRSLVPLFIVAGGGALFLLLSSMRTAPPRVQRVDPGPLVQSIVAPAGSLTVVIHAQGTVRPDREIDLVPQVSGVVEWASPSLEAGGFFASGQVLARIDPEDFELVVEQVRAEVEGARLRLAVEQGEADMARVEWQGLRGDTAPTDPMVLRIPQVRAAEATLRGAQARLRVAELHLERTQLVAPFRGRVRSVSIETGQFVTQGRAVARLYSIDKAELLVPIPDADLAWIEVPSATSPATITDIPDRQLANSARPEGVSIQARFAGAQHQWQGRVVRAEAELDARSRMINLVIEITDPYRLGDALIVDGANVTQAESDQGQVPLLVGLFCDVEIRGHTVHDVRALPRSAVHANDEVWVVDGAGKLRVRAARVVRVGRGQALVRLPMAPGERVITSQLKGVTDGMTVRLVSTSTGQETGR